jgi:hypothetical protein
MKKFAWSTTMNASALCASSEVCENPLILQFRISLQRELWTPEKLGNPHCNDP